MANTNQRPVDTVRYRNIKVSIWQNEGERGTYYSATLTRSYRTADGGWKDTNSFSGLDLLIAAEAMREASSRILKLASTEPSPESESDFEQGGAL